MIHPTQTEQNQTEERIPSNSETIVVIDDSCITRSVHYMPKFRTSRPLAEEKKSTTTEERETYKKDIERELVKVPERQTVQIPDQY